MSLFIPQIVYKEKPISKHPWEHRIKSKHSQTYQYNHNSVENPKYPTQKTDNSKRLRFILIGNRVTREFIYCLHLLKGLYRYRKKQFEAPIIRGVTSVEWPKVWNDLKIQFGQEVFCLDSQVVVLLENEILGGVKELIELINTKYSYNYPKYLDYHKEGIELFSNYVKSCGRPCAYLHVAIDDKPIGPLIFMLYSDITPHTCQNFITLCELTKGGYKGTPIHRIVQDGWIQCGGFGLKSPYKLDCENYIVPHDRRGVLCMANDGRNKECSTQFFVLLQPAIWMKHKYVGFGQLIEGEHTLKKIENIPTWYESPLSNITIYDAGVFNMECHWRPINKTATDYISGHVEDLVILGKLFYDALLENVYAVLDEKLQMAEDFLNVDVKEAKVEKSHPSKRPKSKPSGDTMEKKSSRGVSSRATNNQYDVEEYEDFVMEEMSSGMQTTIILEDLWWKSSKVLERPYYLPLTDVPYPGEVESAFNLQRLLRGDYSLETDQVHDKKERSIGYVKRDSYIVPRELIDALFECYEMDENLSDTSVELCQQCELREYVRQHTDSTSFGGLIIKNMAHMEDKYGILEQIDNKPFRRFTDEELRVFRVTKKEIQNHQKPRVSFDEKKITQSHHKIHRRQTGFIFANEVQKFEEVIEKYVRTEERESNAREELRKIRLDVTDKDGKSIFNRPQTGSIASAEVEPKQRTSTLMRLYREVSLSSENLMPTLKTFRPGGDTTQKYNYTYLRNTQFLEKEKPFNKFIQPKPLQGPALGSALDLQHGKTLSRKVSSDYANTLTRSDKEPATLRSIEYAKQRPSISIVDYKTKNKNYQEEQKLAREKMYQKTK